jgi:hypothetical protein
MTASALRRPGGAICASARSVSTSEQRGRLASVNQTAAGTVHNFVEVYHARAGAALAGVADPGVLHLCTMVPDGSVYLSAFQIGDVDRMAEAALIDARAGKNVYVETRSVRPGLPRERGKLNATVGVFAIVIDHDADTHKAGTVNGHASALVETFPGNFHEWLFLEKALSVNGAKTLGELIRKASGADACTGVITQPYRLAGTPNYLDKKKKARGRVTVPTRLVSINGKLWTPDDIKAAFPSNTIRKLKKPTTQPSRKPAGALNGNGYLYGLINAGEDVFRQFMRRVVCGTIPAASRNSGCRSSKNRKSVTSRSSAIRRRRCPSGGSSLGRPTVRRSASR